jgi:hypothetical protein
MREQARAQQGSHAFNSPTFTIRRGSCALLLAMTTIDSPKDQHDEPRRGWCGGDQQSVASKWLCVRHRGEKQVTFSRMTFKFPHSEKTRKCVEISRSRPLRAPVVRERRWLRRYLPGGGNTARARRKYTRKQSVAQSLFCADCAGVYVARSPWCRRTCT